MKTVYRTVYLCALAVLVATEFYAVVNEAEGDTISEMVWTALDALSASPYHAVALPAVFVAFSGFCLWLVIHFFRRVWGKL